MHHFKILIPTIAGACLFSLAAPLAAYIVEGIISHELSHAPIGAYQPVTFHTYFYQKSTTTTDHHIQNLLKYQGAG